MCKRSMAQQIPETNPPPKKTSVSGKEKQGGIR